MRVQYASIASATANSISRYKVGKLMAELSLASRQQPKHWYRKCHAEHLAISNTLAREFEVSKPNRVWCGDATYIWIGSLWAYLTVVIDLYARKPVGWSLSLSPASQLTKKVLEMVYEARAQTKGLMYHSDQGNYYASLEFRQTL